MDWIARHSVVQCLGLSSRRSATSCGYCRTQEPNTCEDDSDEVEESNSTDSSDERRTVCFGMWGFDMTCIEYQQLCNRGWRRSGRYLYKPVMERTCCPLYTIRLDASKFALSRSQKRVLRLWRDFLQFDKRPPLFSSPDSLNPSTTNNKSKTYTGPHRLKQPTPKRAEPRSNAGMKRKQMRRERAEKRLTEKGIDLERYKEERRSKEENRRSRVEDYIFDGGEGFKHKLEIRTVTAGTPLFDQTFEESFLVYQKYQRVVHNDKDCSRKGFQSFLVDNPFVPSPPKSPNVHHEQHPTEGAYHQQYILDGKIVAVGVIDVLSECVSSAYFFYDPDYKFLNFGTFSALREIDFVRKIYAVRPECKYYYMGYYVHDCRKMRYKAAFRPSELLCEHSHQWVPLPECVDLIERNEGRFTVFCPDAPPAPTASPEQAQPIRYGSDPNHRFKQVPVDEELATKLDLYAKYVGPICKNLFVVV